MIRTAVWQIGRDENLGSKRVGVTDYLYGNGSCNT